MVLHKLFSFICHYMAPRRPMRIKESVAPHMVVTVGITAAGLSTSPVGSSSSSGGSFGGEVCCVCLSRLKEDMDVRVLPCMHEFHRACIDRWLDTRRRTCPVCRFSMEGGDEGCHRGEELTDEMVIWFSSFHAAGF